MTTLRCIGSMPSPMQPDLEGGDRIINEQIKGALHATSSAATINRSVASLHSSSTNTFQNKSQICNNEFSSNTQPHYLHAQHYNYHYTTDAYVNFYGGVTYTPDPSSFQTTNNSNNNNISTATRRHSMQPYHTEATRPLFQDNRRFPVPIVIRQIDVMISIILIM